MATVYRLNSTDLKALGREAGTLYPTRAMAEREKSYLLRKNPGVTITIETGETTQGRLLNLKGIVWRTV